MITFLFAIFASYTLHPMNNYKRGLANFGGVLKVQHTDETKIISCKEIRTKTKHRMQLQIHKFFAIQN